MAILPAADRRLTLRGAYKTDLDYWAASPPFGTPQTWTARQTYQTNVAAPVTFGDNALLAVRQTRGGIVPGDPALAVYDSSRAFPYLLETYILDSGAYYSGRQMVLSQKRYGNGSIQGIADAESGTLDLSSDGNFCTLKLENGLALHGANAYALATFDEDDIDPAYPASAYSPGTGKKKLVIGPAGQHLWGASLGTNPAANADIGLGRTAARTLRVDGYGGDTTLAVNAPSTFTPYLQLIRSGTVTGEWAAQATTTTLKTAGVTNLTTYAASSVPRVAIGGDRSTSTLSVLIGNAGFPGLTVKQAAAQAADLLNVVDNASEAILSRLDKNGYFMTRKTTVPADADLAAGELALWFDPTNGAAKLMVKAKEAGGTVRTGALALV